MEPPNTEPSSPLTIHSNLWLEVNDKVALSLWRVQLLEAIEETGSISAAATRMKIPYHLAWDRLDEMEEALGVRLVERQRGGPKGGGAQLTSAGGDYVGRFKRFAAEMDIIVERLFKEAFGDGE